MTVDGKRRLGLPHLLVAVGSMDLVVALGAVAAWAYSQLTGYLVSGLFMLVGGALMVVCGGWMMQSRQMGNQTRWMVATVSQTRSDAGHPAHEGQDVP